MCQIYPQIIAAKGVTLPNKGGESIRFAIGAGAFLSSITAAVAFMNAHLPQILDAIGAP